MKHPIITWSIAMVEEWRTKSACIGKKVDYVFTDVKRNQAIAKLQILYSKGRVNPTFADKILYISELY